MGTSDDNASPDADPANAPTSRARSKPRRAATAAKQTDNSGAHQINLSTPWGTAQGAANGFDPGPSVSANCYAGPAYMEHSAPPSADPTAQPITGHLPKSVSGNPSAATMETFITERSNVHSSYIRETEATKRIALVCALLAMVTAAAVMIFAPQGREAMSCFIGAALMIFAAGAVGYTYVSGKTGKFSFNAGNASAGAGRQSSTPRRKGETG